MPERSLYQKVFGVIFGWGQLATVGWLSLFLLVIAAVACAIWYRLRPPHMRARPWFFGLAHVQLLFAILCWVPVQIKWAAMPGVIVDPQDMVGHWPTEIALLLRVLGVESAVLILCVLLVAWASGRSPKPTRFGLTSVGIVMLDILVAVAALSCITGEP